MNGVLLRNFIASVINEDAYSRQTGQKFDFSAKLKALHDLSKTSPNTYFFTMTSIPKVGVNPRSEYNTPLGVYCYPLDDEHYKQLLKDTLPFVSQSPYITVLKATSPSTMLHLNEAGADGTIQTQEELDALSKKVVKRLDPNVSEQDITGILAEANRRNKHRNENFDASFFGLTYILSNSRGGIGWTSLLRYCGFSAANDPGHGIIHPNEPTQCVFLDTSAYRIVESFNTNDIRRNVRGFSPEQKYSMAMFLIGKTDLLNTDLPQDRKAQVALAKHVISTGSVSMLQKVLENQNLSEDLKWLYYYALSRFAAKRQSALTIKEIEKFSLAALSQLIILRNNSSLNYLFNKQIIEWLLAKNKNPAYASLKDDLYDLKYDVDWLSEFGIDLINDSAADFFKNI